MRVRIAAVVALLVASPAIGRANQENADAWLDYFQLFNECRPMYLLIERLSGDEADIGLTEARIQTMVEARLRSARLYDGSVRSPYLYVQVTVVGRAFNFGISFKKTLYDPVTDRRSVATTWDVGGTGTHGSDAGYVLQALSEFVDTFVVEYLRVNEAVC